jgi:adenosylmethionine-8-amino-7-oxononanoate aminotransferase
MVERVIEWEGPETVAALIVDPVMITAGILVPPDQYLQTLRQICDRNDVLLIFDEVITGFGRTGKMFAMDTFDVTPDIAAMAKGMSSGYAPLAGIIASERLADAFWGEENGFTSGHTFGGNPLSATAGIANIKQIQEAGLIDNAGRIGSYLQERGQPLRQRKMVGDVRGIGLILGVEFVADRTSRAPFPADVKPGLKVQEAAIRRGMLLRASPGWVAMAPPLIATEADIDSMLDILEASIDEVEARILEA